MTDTEKAIEITQRQIEELKSNLPTLVTQEYYDSFNLAIEVKKLSVEALQEKAERDKGCATCNKPNLFIKQHNPPYCPMCGRKLNNAPTGSL